MKQRFAVDELGSEEAARAGLDFFYEGGPTYANTTDGRGL